MIVVSFGITKSGSTLAFEMAKVVLELNGHEQPRLPDHLVTRGHHINFVRDWSDRKLAELIEATDGSRVVVKTHRGPDALTRAAVLEAIDSGDLRIHVVYRDPRDTIVAMFEHRSRQEGSDDPPRRRTRTLDQAIRRLARQVGRLRSWGSFPSLQLRYEEFAFDPGAGPRAIADDLGVTVDPSEVWESLEQRFTQKNVARPRRYTTDLWPDEIARIERAFPMFIELSRGNRVVGWFEELR